MDSKTAICRHCKNYVPVDLQVAGSRRVEDGTVVCIECKFDQL